LRASSKPLLGLLLASRAFAQAGSTPDFFESKVRPILATNCYACHANSQLAGLRLDSRAAMLKGGQSGPSLVPGDPDRSLLIQAVRQTGELKMPKGGKLKKEEVDALVESPPNPGLMSSGPSSVPSGRSRPSASPRFRRSRTRHGRKQISIVSFWLGSRRKA
jgi:hypothetical protein